KTCTPLWTGATGGAVESSPAVAGGVVYVGSFDTKLYAFSFPPTDVSVSKSGPASAAPGSSFTYGISVANTSATTAFNLSLTDPLPAGVTFVSETHPGGWTCTDPAVGTNGTLTCTKPSLAPGALTSVNLVVHASPTTTGQMSNT